MIPALMSLGKFFFCQLISFDVYNIGFVTFGIAFGHRGIRCSIKSVLDISLIYLIIKSFYVAISLCVIRISSGVEVNF